MGSDCDPDTRNTSYEEAIMQVLSEPNQTLAARILQDVTYDQRLVGYRCRARWGQMRAHVYSLKELARLLKDKHPIISLRDLEDWVRTVMGDAELADRIAETVAAEPTDRERLQRLGVLLDQRLAQSQQIAARYSGSAANGT
jgi:hypothetical protein